MLLLELVAFEQAPLTEEVSELTPHLACSDCILSAALKKTLTESGPVCFPGPCHYGFTSDFYILELCELLPS